MNYDELHQQISDYLNFNTSDTEDRYSQDADVIAKMAREAFIALGVERYLEPKKYDGGHALTQGRFDDIVGWVVSCCGVATQHNGQARFS